MEGVPVVSDGDVWRAAPAGTRAEAIVIEPRWMAELGRYVGSLLARDARASDCLEEP